MVLIFIGLPGTEDINCALVESPTANLRLEALEEVLQQSLPKTTAIQMHVYTLDALDQMVEEMVTIPSINQTFNIMPYIGRIGRIDVLQETCKPPVTPSNQ